jgi:HEPN domain-containing protein
MALTLVVLLPPGHRPADADPSFGPLVEQHFPAAAYDIEEMAHCLALRRSTAAVLHAMQAMRHGLLGLERLLSTAGLPDLSWTRLIAIVRDARGDFNDVVVALGRVRRAWRAPGLPPAAKYTEEEAETVLAAVEALMRAVAARLEAADDMVKL